MPVIPPPPSNRRRGGDPRRPLRRRALMDGCHYGITDRRATLPHRASSLLGRIERRRAALLEIAEPQDARTQLRKLAGLGQRQAADQLGRFCFAAGLDLPPIVLRAPLPVRPVLHLIGPLRLHSISPTSRARACGVRPVFGDNLAYQSNDCEFCRRVLAVIEEERFALAISAFSSRFA